MKVEDVVIGETYSITGENAPWEGKVLYAGRVTPGVFVVRVVGTVDRVGSGATREIPARQIKPCTVQLDLFGMPVAVAA